MDFKELVEKARTCRRFEEDRPLTMNDLEWLVDCARLAPSARNAQDLRFSLVAPGDTCKKLFALTRWAGALKDWGGPHPGEQPTAFVAIFMPQGATELTFYDVGIAAQTMQLAASSRCCSLRRPPGNQTSSNSGSAGVAGRRPRNSFHARSRHLSIHPHDLLV